MRPVRICLLVTTIALALVVGVPLAFGASAASTMGNTNELDVGTLSDRYDSLNNLGKSLTEEENVVIATRVAVLTSANRALDGSEVSFTGETVGDVVNAEAGYKWVNIMGTADTVISVRMTDEQAGLIQNSGSYQATGTVFKIAGTYHIACAEHQGELDVHADEVEVTDAGGPTTHLIASGRIMLACIVCLIAAAILVTFFFARRRWNALEAS